MNKKVIRMPRVQNVIKYGLVIVFLGVIVSCASQNVDRKDQTTLANQLIKEHFFDKNNKKAQHYLHFKTLNKESMAFLMKEKGISNFLRYDKFSSPSKKCYIDLTLSKRAQQQLDSAYADFEEVELSPETIKSKNLNLIYPNSKVHNNELVSRITFPIIIHDNSVYYGILTQSNVHGGDLYFYKYEKGIWKLICHRMLFVV